MASEPPANPPIRDAVLLITDVVDSTRLVERLGDARMAEVWIAHDRVVRDLLPRWRGREADRTDGFLLLFDAVDDAVGFAGAFHAAMAALSERFGVVFAARVGIHRGPVILIETSARDRARGAKPLEVEGLAKPTAARVMSVAAAGQTLLTPDARACLDAEAVVSHGHWRMKGVSEPIELFEVDAPGAPLAPPPDGEKVYRVAERDGVWVPLREVPHRLPSERDAFLGRSEDLRRLAERLDAGAALVSVTGPGGAGKTRLVTRFAWTWLGDFPGGAYFCDLSEARDVDGLVSQVARALDVPLGSGDAVVRLGQAIAGRGACLIVLDNFEQVVAHARGTVGAWLDRCPEARFLVTTREVLGLPGESTLALPPLDEGAALELFVERARAARADFVLADDERAAVSALVRALDLLPLAIELAAARVRVMRPATILERLGERFRLLAAPGGRASRQSTLRATLDWSWDLLDADERAALAQLSVFEGGFDLAAAEAVLALDGAWPVDAVQGLVDKSLVRPNADERFTLLVTVHAYAAERLAQAGAVKATELRHAAWYARSPSSERADLDNRVAACRRAVAHADGALALDALAMAWRALERRGPFGLGVDLAERVLALPGSTPAQRGRASLIAGRACRVAGRLDRAHTHLEAALAAPLDAPERGEAELESGLVHRIAGRGDEARACYESALASSVARGDGALEGAVLNAFGSLERDQGRREAAHARWEAALALHRALGDRRREAMVLGNLGLLALEDGAYDAARARFEASLSIHREGDDRLNEGILLGNLGLVHMEQQRSAEARAHYEAALAIARDLGNRRHEGFLLGSLGALVADEGGDAAPILDAALAVAREVGDRRGEGHLLGTLGGLDLEAGRLGSARERYEAALALHREVGDRRHEGHVLGRLGVVYARAGDRARALALFAEGEALLVEVGDAIERDRLVEARRRL